MAYFRSDIDIIVFFLLGGMKMSGSAGLFNIFFYLVGRPNVGGVGDGKHKKNTATLRQMQVCHNILLIYISLFRTQGTLKNN